MYFGAPVMIPVPSGEQFAIAQALPNTMAKEAMQDKINLMIGLGAMVIQPGSAVKTATQAAGEQATRHSILSLIASNVSEGYTKALQWAARFMAADESECSYTVQQNFVDQNAEPQMLREMIAGFLQGAIPAVDYHRWMQRHQLADEEQPFEEFAEGLTLQPVPDLDN
jgi:hypothetical protein